MTFSLSSRPIYLGIGDELDGVKRNPFEKIENNPLRNIFLSFLFEIKSPKFDFEFLSFLVFTFLGFLGYLKVIKIVTLKKCDEARHLGHQCLDIARTAFFSTGVGPVALNSVCEELDHILRSAPSPHSATIGEGEKFYQSAQCSIVKVQEDLDKLLSLKDKNGKDVGPDATTKVQRAEQVVKHCVGVERKSNVSSFAGCD